MISPGFDVRIKAVIPAKAGIQHSDRGKVWIPAFAGMTTNLVSAPLLIR
jgi:hypothetical protein